MCSSGNSAKFLSGLLDWSVLLNIQRALLPKTQQEICMDNAITSDKRHAHTSLSADILPYKTA